MQTASVKHVYLGKDNGVSNVLNRKSQGESSLTRGLLHDIPLEIEMSDYRKISISDNECPSLLNRDRLNLQPIANLDFFFEKIYRYYCEKGLGCIITKWIVELLSLGFTICFSGFIFLYVDWNALRNAKCGIDAVKSGRQPCDLVKEALHQHPLTPLTIIRVIIVLYLGIFLFYWIYNFLKFFLQLKDILEIRQFYYNSLRVTDNEIQTMSWATILEKIVLLQNSQKLCVLKDLSAHDIMMRLMRKENYLIGMLNKGVLAFSISKWVPGVGPTVKFGTYGTQYRLILTETLEWALNWCILQNMFDRNFCVRLDFVSNSEALKKWLRIVGIVMFLLSPFLVIFMLARIFLRNAERFYNQPSTISSRRWSNLSRWVFREFNEVDHLFKHRINTSVLYASNYIKQFPSPIVSIIAKFISFVSGGFVAILIIVAFLEESLLEAQIFGRNLLWYVAIFGTITAIRRRVVFTDDELLVTDSKGAMSMLVDHTHYMPKRWRDKENTQMVRNEFETLFQYSGMMLLEEMASIFVTPFLLLFVVQERVDDILQFIENFTVYVEGVGDVCSFSVFNFQENGNSSYGSPFNVPRSQRSSQGKLEKSFFSFQSSYPFWEPNAQGKQFLQNLRTFRDKKVTEHVNRRGYPPIRPWRGHANMGSYGDTNREMLHSTLVTGNHLGRSLLLSECSYQNNHHYLLDWYYTSQRPYATPRHISTNAFEVTKHPSPDWMPSILEQNEHEYEEEYMNKFCNELAASHLGAPTSAPIFRESLIKDPCSIDVPLTTRSSWWARSQPRSEQGQTSFLEPPDFNHRTTFNHHDRYSDRGSEDEGQEQPLYHGGHGQASLLEPPDFNHQTTYNHHDKFSDKGSEDEGQEQPLYQGGHGQASLLEPPDFNNQATYNHHDKFSDKGSEDHDQEHYLGDYQELSSIAESGNLDASQCSFW